MTSLRRPALPTADVAPPLTPPPAAAAARAAAEDAVETFAPPVAEIDVSVRLDAECEPRSTGPASISWANAPILPPATSGPTPPTPPAPPAAGELDIDPPRLENNGDESYS